LVIILCFQTALLHRNLRILLCNQSVALMFMAISRGIIDLNALLHIINVSTNVKDSSNGAEKRFIICKSFTAIYDCSLYSSILMFVVLAIERIIATVRARTYENESRKLPFILITASWSICIALIVASVCMEFSDNDIWVEIEKRGTVLTCAQTFFGPKVLLYYLFGITVVNVSTLIIFLLVFRHNYLKYCSITDKSGEHSLSERYQTIEIVKATKFLFPSVAVILIENAFAITIVAIIASNVQNSSANIDEIIRLWVFEQLYTITAILFACSEPVVGILFHSALKEKLYEMLYTITAILFACSEPVVGILFHSALKEKLYEMVIIRIRYAFCGKSESHETVTTSQGVSNANSTPNLRAKDLCGRRIFFSPKEERDVYFAKLKDAWSSPKIRTTLAPTRQTNNVVAK
ncbi:Serpentine receptor class alpha/beta-14, partial [Toxocara canis]